MTKGTSVNFYTQANAGVLRNSDNAFYSNIGASAGFKVNANFDGKNTLYYGAEGGIGTAVTAKAEIGYKRALSKNSNLVFGAKFTYDKSLNKENSYDVHIDNNATVNGKFYQLDLVDKHESWKPDHMQYGGKIGYNKTTKWGGYEVGAEVGYRTNSSPEFHKASGTNSTFEIDNSDMYKDLNLPVGNSYNNVTYKYHGDNKLDIQTQWEYGRERKEGMVATPYGKIWANITSNGALKAIGQVDSHQIGATIRYTF